MTDMIRILVLAGVLLASPAIPARLQVGALDLPVVTQGGDPAFVSPQPGALTLFETPFENGVIGLLAHNYLAGAQFYQLHPGDRLTLRYPGNTETYQVHQVLQFQALGERWPYFEFVDLQTGETLSDVDVYARVYQQAPGALVLQTCLARDGKPDWGLTFWLAYPAPAAAVFLPAVRRDAAAGPQPIRIIHPELIAQ